MGILRWIQRQGRKPQRRDDKELVAMTARVTALNPRLRLVPHYEKRLAPRLATALEAIRATVDGLPAPREASEAAWDSDPHIHAYFGTAADVVRAFSRSPDLREFFDRTPFAEHAYAVLGMAMNERRTLGVALEGDVMHTDVPQTLVSFSDYQLRICAESEAALRAEILLRMLDQLAIEAMAQFAAGKGRRDTLERELALLKAQLKLYERQGMGLRSMVGGETADAAAVQSVRDEIAQNDSELAALGHAGDTLERQLECLGEVLGDAANRMHVEMRQIRLSQVNVMLPADSTAPGVDLELLCAHVPGDPPLVRWFSIVRYARADILSQATLLDEAARML
ncbi:hypothetical protein LMG31506_00026 [Cupriavidus yeoncheonensis]|uniref:Uncharacterized protein n=1 Tax=Cupriavidus yeoncheonensis TaxID=1462994 RepID=A0A916IQF4_9BURK|nr:hypothetical protein [Cupriavidus yeoncheonensis]CAG2126541.1 hypothetical protein LMG31506_00026 [Cupriavidus yeoncheonensis]